MGSRRTSLRPSAFTRRFSSLGFSLLTSMGLGSCFAAEFDPDLDAVYVCNFDSDCGEESLCIANLCRDNRGPSLSVQEPEPQQIFRASELRTPLTITVRGRDLDLAPAGGSNAPNRGYIELLLDGKRVALVESGFVESSVAVGDIKWPTTAGLHRIQAIARNSDGTRYENPSAHASSVFWIDDGTPQIGIISPGPDQEISNDEPVSVEVRTLNFEMLNPQFDEDFDPDADPLPRVGHAHLFFNMDIPTCLSGDPSCNGGYVARLWPQGTKGSSMVRWTGPLALRASPGRTALSAVLQTTGHQPYPSAEPDRVAFDIVFVDVLPD